MKPDLSPLELADLLEIADEYDCVGAKAAASLIRNLDRDVIWNVTYVTALEKRLSSIQLEEAVAEADKAVGRDAQ